jgi:hypothetical protein
MRIRALAPAVLLCATTVASSLHAQGTLSEQTRERAVRWPQQIISINPFLPLFGYFQGEYEHRLKENVSFALSGSYMRFDDYYTNLDAKLRLYPQERAPDGLGLAAGVGIGSVRRSGYTICDEFYTTCREDKSTQTAPTFSVEMQYQWLLGSSRSTAVALGGGVKRYFIANDRSDGIERVVPTFRVTIGYAF